ELGRDSIRVNSIAPSAVLTESTREFFGEKHERARGHCWRPGDPAQHYPKDVCGAMLWLASEQSAFVTGQTIAVDGGTVMLVASGAPMPASAALRQPALAAPVALHIVV